MLGDVGIMGGRVSIGSGMRGIGFSKIVRSMEIMVFGEVGIMGFG